MLIMSHTLDVSFSLLSCSVKNSINVPQCISSRLTHTGNDIHLSVIHGGGFILGAPLVILIQHMEGLGVSSSIFL